MIREATLLELESIKGIVKEVFSSEFDINEFSRVYVYDDENILGFLIFSVIYERAEIEYIYVLEEFRNKQIASKLLEKMFKKLNENNVKTVSLEVMVENISAINLYTKNFFNKVAIRKKYYKNKDAYLMVREVD